MSLLYCQLSEVGYCSLEVAFYSLHRYSRFDGRGISLLDDDDSSHVDGTRRWIYSLLRTRWPLQEWLFLTNVDRRYSLGSVDEYVANIRRLLFVVAYKETKEKIRVDRHG